MHKFSWRTMLIFVASLFLAVMRIGLGTAYISELKQQRRQLSSISLFIRHPNEEFAIQESGGHAASFFLIRLILGRLQFGRVTALR